MKIEPKTKPYFSSDELDQLMDQALEQIELTIITEQE